MDNCTACTTAKFLNVLQGAADEEGLTANAVEANFGYAGKERSFTVNTSANYIKNALEESGYEANWAEAPFNGPDAEPGMYALYPRYRGQPYGHVVFGQVGEDGSRLIFDAQSGESWDWASLTSKYDGGAKPILFKIGKKQ